jgi:hypothetical protein
MTGSNVSGDLLWQHISDVPGIEVLHRPGTPGFDRAVVE